MSEPSDYAARDAPAEFSEFMAAVDGAAASHGGIMVDADLYEDFFGHAPGLLSRDMPPFPTVSSPPSMVHTYLLIRPSIWTVDILAGSLRQLPLRSTSSNKGASPDFIASLPRPAQSNLPTGDASCPVCLQTLAALATEEEYALASDSYFGDLEALGLRELPCPAKHVLCARCAKQWLALNNSCPMCRAVVDPSRATDAETADTIERQRETEQMLGLFQALFRRPAPAPRRDDAGRESFAGMYS